MSMKRSLWAWFTMTALTLSAAGTPVIYCTDLFHPHDDPDDHFDLATLFALPELEVKAILLDQGDRQLKTPGSIPLGQMMHLTGRQIPFAIGLGQKLRSPTDDGLAQPAEFQAAVNLVLKALREASGPVTVIATGSVRDLCAAWNRQPALVRQKVGRLYLNIGNADSTQSEYNVDLDPQAYVGLLHSGLPIYLCPCLPMQRENSNALYSTWWRFPQSEVLPSASRDLQNYFIYALQKCAPEELDPIEGLQTDLRPWHRLVWEMDRNMWCTASFLHAAGRTIRKINGAWTASRQPLPDANTTEPFTFIPARVEVDQAGKTTLDLKATNSNMHVFKLVASQDYGPAMRDCLRDLFRSLAPPLFSQTDVFISGKDGYHSSGSSSIQPPSPRVISRGESAGTYQAFPDICRMKNGDLFCVFYAGYGHVSLPRENFPKGGRVCWVRSADEGRTWSAPHILFDGPFDDRDPHIAQMRDGTVVCSFFTYRPQPEGKVRCDTCLVTSRDEGATWESEARIVAPEWPASAPVRDLPDGTRILGVYREDGPTAYGGIIRSTDGGKTWCPPIPIGRGSGVRLDAETDFVLLKDGTLYAALRGDRVNMHFATSQDTGLTWSPVKDIGFPGHCPHFTRLSTGEILLVHRLPLTALHISRDEARTWQGPYPIDDTPGAYPSTVELKDGSVLVVYYEEGPSSAIRARRFKVNNGGIEFLELKSR
jgi:sialidase-1